VDRNLGGSKVKMESSCQHLAEKLTLAFSAPTFALIAVIIFSLLSPIGLGPFLGEGTSILLGALFLSILPIFPIIYYARKGVVDLQVSERRMRPKLFAMAILGYSSGTILFALLSATSLMVLSLAYVGVTTSMALVSFFWKISVHTSGIAGPVTALTYVFGWTAALMYLWLLPIGWARLELKAHTFPQVLGGAVTAALITLVIYVVFYPAPPKPWF
jgi:membrane-associated phospholipid phosphatase